MILLTFDSQMYQNVEKERKVKTPVGKNASVNLRNTSNRKTCQLKVTMVDLRAGGVPMAWKNIPEMENLQ